MKERNYHIGEKFNKLTILDKAEDEINIYGKKYAMVKCKCDCGEIVFARKDNVTSGLIKSCKKCKYKKIGKAKIKNIENQTFGKWKVLKETPERNSSGEVLWECQCECGEIQLIPSKNLRSKSSTQCIKCARKIDKIRGIENRKYLIGQTFNELTFIGEPKEIHNFQSNYMSCRCSCGNEIDAQISLVKNGTVWCCGCNKIKSYGEKRIKEFLDKKIIKYTQQKRFFECRYKIPLPFDFYLDELNILIEFQGIQHCCPTNFKKEKRGEVSQKDKEKYLLEFSKQLKKDHVKEDFCAKNNIKFIKIYYWDINKINEILQKELNL